VQYYQKAADQGFTNAQYNLGLMFENGRGVAQSDVKAVHWYTKAAEQGQAMAQNNLGLKVLHGRGVAQSYAEAMRWFRKAADQGEPQAEFNLKVHFKKKWHWSSLIGCGGEMVYMKLIRVLKKVSEIHCDCCSLCY